MQEWMHLSGTTVKVAKGPGPSNILKNIIACIAIAAAAAGAIYIIGKLKK